MQKNNTDLIPPLLKSIFLRFCSPPVITLVEAVEKDPERFIESSLLDSKKDRLWGYTWPEQIIIKALHYKLCRMARFTYIYDELLDIRSDSRDE